MEPTPETPLNWQPIETAEKKYFVEIVCLCTRYKPGSGVQRCSDIATLYDGEWKSREGGTITHWCAQLPETPTLHHYSYKPG